MAKVRFDTVREIPFSPDQLTTLSDNLQSAGHLYSLSQLISSGPDPIRLAQVKDVIETVITGRKYEVLLIRSQGRTFAEIALLLEISKSAVQSHHRQAVRRVRRALGLEEQDMVLPALK